MGFYDGPNVYEVSMVLFLRMKPNNSNLFAFFVFIFFET